jgi:hypothetical protein
MFPSDRNTSRLYYMTSIQDKSKLYLRSDVKVRIPQFPLMSWVRCRWLTVILLSTSSSQPILTSQTAGIHYVKPCYVGGIVKKLSISSSTSSRFLTRPSGLFPNRINLELWVLQTIDRTPWTDDQSCRKAATYTEHHEHRRNAERDPCLEWVSNPRFRCLSGWRPRGHCDPQFQNKLRKAYNIKFKSFSLYMYGHKSFPFHYVGTLQLALK